MKPLGFRGFRGFRGDYLLRATTFYYFKLKSVSKKNQTLSLAYSAKTIDSRAKMNFLEYNERVQRRKMRYCTSL